jgi:catechol 2,3-dioxygenase-like lactoylglutathione lyase family enzyme
MFSHVMVGSNDIARSKKFYDALFVAMGGKPGVEDAKGRLTYAHDGGRFMVSKPIDGKPAGTLPLYATWETVTSTELLPGLLQCHIFAISARARGVLPRDGPCIHKRHATFRALSPRVGPHQGRLEPFEFYPV